MKKKKSQVFSIDLIFAVIIFLVAVALFYYNIRFIPEEKIEKRLKIDQDFLFTNIEENTKIYDEEKGKDTSFLSDFRVDQNKLKNFAQIKYKDFTKILFKNIIVTGLDVDACLYFTNRSDFIVPINDGEKDIAGIGNLTNEFIIVEADDELIKEDDINCGLESKNTKATPYCWGNYEFTRLFSKPVLMKREQYSEIMTMNVLVCAREKDSTLFLPKPEATCFDGIKNQDEEKIDCGGICSACPQYCSDGTLYGKCSANKPKYCDNGILLENYCYGSDMTVGTADDCGCFSGECQQGGNCEVIIIPTCSDGIQNQGEEGIDCGGPCDACPEEPPTETHTICDENICKIISGVGISECLIDTDCEIPPEEPPTETHTICDENICKIISGEGESECLTDSDCEIPPEEPEIPTCSDGIQNQGEEGIDCGGPCDACEIPPEIPTCFKTNDGIELCGNNIDEDCDGIKRACPPKCKPKNSGIEICGNEIDEDCDGKDKECAVPGCMPKNSGIEICGNNLDEDCDGEDKKCVPGCIPTNNGIEICGNNIDENCNGFDDACINIADCTTRECRLTSGVTHKKKPVWFGFLILILLLFIFVILLISIYKLVKRRKA